MKDMNKLVEELFGGYADGWITDRELGDMLDLVTNTYTVVVNSNDDFDWNTDMEIEQYELEATQYDYI